MEEEERTSGGEGKTRGGAVGKGEGERGGKGLGREGERMAPWLLGG